MKVQPYMQTIVDVISNLKLSSKYYWPYRVIEKIGLVAYKLTLPHGPQIHPVFHVSQLKKRVGECVVSLAKLPLTGPDGEILAQLVATLEKRLIKRKKKVVVEI